MKKICGHIYFTNEQYSKFNEIVENYPNLLSVINFGKVSKTASILTFALSEIYNYLQRKLDDGTYLFNIRNLYLEKLILQQKIDKINKHL